MIEPSPALRSRSVLLVALLTAVVSCGTSHPLDRPDPLGVEERSVAGMNELQLQAVVMGMADDYGGHLGEAIYLLVASDELDARGRALALSFLRNGMGAALDIGASSNPSVALLDILVLSRLQAWAFEKHWIPAGVGSAEGPATAAAAERLRTAARELRETAALALSPEQLATLDSLVADWQAAHADQMVVSLVRFGEFSELRRLPTVSREAASGLLADVEAATAVVEDAMLLGERVLWFSSRIPYVFGQQAELTSYRLASQPEAALIRESLSSLRGLVDQLTLRMETLDSDLSEQQAQVFSRLRAEREATLEDLAARVDLERQRAIDQAFDRVAGERSAFFDDLEQRQAEFLPIMKELRELLRGSDDLARDLTGTLEVLDRIVARFDKGPEDASEPLDIKDVTAAAAEASKTIENLSGLLRETNATLDSPEWDSRLDRIDEATARVVDRAFWRGLWLILILLAGLALLRLLPRRGA